jgi:hypothetical protein
VVLVDVSFARQTSFKMAERLLQQPLGGRARVVAVSRRTSGPAQRWPGLPGDFLEPADSDTVSRLLQVRAWFAGGRN